VAHRHLGYFGFFCIGSIGIMALVCQGIDALRGWFPWAEPAGGWAATAVLCVEAGVALVCLGLYFYLLFGYLSRRFERQADVYGCRAVSCGRMSCPPHAELLDGGASSPARVPPVLCPVGIQTFASALSEVAALNGLEPAARSWRHGSILRRIAFLQGLEGRPEAERRFQDSVRRLRLGLAVGLLAALAAAAATGAFEKL
jgi:STE24 endopeptidase